MLKWVMLYPGVLLSLFVGNMTSYIRPIISSLIQLNSFLLDAQSQR